MTMIQTRVAWLLSSLVAFLMCHSPVSAATINTVAGGGSVDGTLAQSALSLPQGLAVDGTVVYVSEPTSHSVRKVDLINGTVVTIAGAGYAGFKGDDGLAINAVLNFPVELAVDASHNVYISDRDNFRIRKVDAITGKITTIAGTGQAGFSGDGGLATQAQINNVESLACDASGNLYVGDSGNFRLRKIDASTQFISTISGTGIKNTQGAGDGGPASAASLSGIAGIACDQNGTVYFSDREAHLIRRIDLAGGIATYVQGLNDPRGLGLDSSGNLYIGDVLYVYKVDATGTTITIVAGDGTSIPTENVPPLQSGLFIVYGLGVLPNGNVVFAEREHNFMRGINFFSDFLVTIVGNPVLVDNTDATTASLGSLIDIAVNNSGEVYMVETASNRIRKYDINTGKLKTVCERGIAGFEGDGGPAADALMNNPQGGSFDSAGNYYFADSFNNRIRRITPAGMIDTVAGGGNVLGDGGLATAALVNDPQFVATDAADNLYIAEFTNRIRRVDAVTKIITTIAGTGVAGFSGDGGAATSAMLNYPNGIAVASDGSIYITDVNNYRLRRVKDGIITTVCGDGLPHFTGDGGLAVNAGLSGLLRVSIDAADNLYLPTGIYTVDHRVRRIDATTGNICTIVGTGKYEFLGDGGPATAAHAGVVGLCFGPSGEIYLSDYKNNRLRVLSDDDPRLMTVAPFPGRTDSPSTYSTNFKSELSPTYTWDFGNGSATVSGNPVQHNFLADGQYTVKVTATSGANTFSFTRLQVILKPNDGAEGQLNVANGRKPGIGDLRVEKSNGGALEYAVSNTMGGAALFTNFTDDLNGVKFETRDGTSFSQRFEQPGIYIATTDTVNSVNQRIDRVRRTIPISNKEVGKSVAKPDTRTTTEIKQKMLKGTVKIGNSAGRVIKPVVESITFQGTIEIPVGAPMNETSISIGNIVDKVSVDAKGNAILPSKLNKIKAFKISAKKPAKGSTVQTATIQVTINQEGMIAAGLDSEGVKPRQPGDGKSITPLKLQMQMLIGGYSYDTLLTIQYTIPPGGDFGTLTGRSSK